MFVLKTLIICAAWLTVYCQGLSGPTTTPVPILKQINRQNDDGSYSFGYEAADGSFKIETKYPNGDVAGKYGYVDENGKLREISYGASSKRGFEPEGPGIMVPPPTLNNPNTNALSDGQEDDGQYREDPSIYEDPKYNRKSQSRPTAVQYHQPAAPTPAPYRQQAKYQSAPLYTSTQDENIYRQSPQQFPDDDYRPQSQVYHQQPQFSYQASIPQNYQNYQPQNYQQQNYQQQNYQQQNYQQQNYQQQNYQQPSYQQQNYQPQNYQNYNPYSSHPALQNLDPNTGSYTINFTG